MALRFMSDDEDSDLENSLAHCQLQLEKLNDEKQLKHTMSSSVNPSLPPLTIPQDSKQEEHGIQWRFISPVHSESSQSPVVSEYGDNDDEEEEEEHQEDQELEQVAEGKKEEKNDPIQEEEHQEQDEESQMDVFNVYLKTQLDCVSPAVEVEEPMSSPPRSQSYQDIQEILRTSNQTRWEALKARASSSSSMVRATAVAVKRHAFPNGSYTNGKSNNLMTKMYDGDFSSDDEGCCQKMRSSFDYDERDADNTSRKFDRRSSFRLSRTGATSAAIAAARMSVCSLQEVMKKSSNGTSRAYFMRFRTQYSTTASTCSDRTSASSTTPTRASHQIKTRASLYASKAVEIAQSVSKQKVKYALSVVDSATRIVSFSTSTPMENGDSNAVISSASQ
jgi:hypothetical protein